MLLDPYRTVVQAAAYAQPTAGELAGMSVLEAHCGAWQQVGGRDARLFGVWTGSARARHGVATLPAASRALGALQATPAHLTNSGLAAIIAQLARLSLVRPHASTHWADPNALV